MSPSNFNIFPILACAVASMVIGFIWYSKPLFLKPWLESIGKTEDFVKNPQMVKYLYLFLVSLIEAWFVALVLAMITVPAPSPDLLSMADGLQAGLIVWMGFVATTSFANNLMSGGSFKLFMIQAGNHLVTLLVMGAILSVWH